MPVRGSIGKASHKGMKRVLSLLPSATEIVYRLGAADALVGVTHECDFPAEALGKPRVTEARIDPSMQSETIDALVREQLDSAGSLYTLRMDIVRELRPQVVLTQQLCTVCAVGYETVHAAMRTLPQPPQVINLEPATLNDVLQTHVAIGELLGLGDRAAEVVAELRAQLERIPGITPAPRVLLLEWLAPPFSAGHWMGDLVEAAGAQPVLADRGTYSRQLAWDAIAEAVFDVVVISCCGFSVERAMQDVLASGELRKVLAGRPGVRVIVFDGNHFFSRPGPRLAESAELLNKALRGIPSADSGASIADAYRELQPGQILA